MIFFLRYAKILYQIMLDIFAKKRKERRNLQPKTLQMQINTTQKMK